MMLFYTTDSLTLSPLEIDPTESLSSLFFYRITAGVLIDSDAGGGGVAFNESLKLNFFPEE